MPEALPLGSNLCSAYQPLWSIREVTQPLCLMPSPWRNQATMLLWLKENRHDQNSEQRPLYRQPSANASLDDFLLGFQSLWIEFTFGTQALHGNSLVNKFSVLPLNLPVSSSKLSPEHSVCARPYLLQKLVSSQCGTDSGENQLNNTRFFFCLFPLSLCSSC